MLFRRRKPEGFWGRTRTLIWPRRSFGRSFSYFFKRVLRLTATPHAIAAGVAAGVFASCTPFLGLHFLIAFGLAYVLAGNLVAAAIGTAFGNPLSFPLIWTMTLKLGKTILGREYQAHAHDVDLVRLFAKLDLTQLWDPILKPMAIGGLPLGLGFGIFFYGLTYWSVQVFQRRRRLRLAARSRDRLGSRLNRKQTV